MAFVLCIIIFFIPVLAIAWFTVFHVVLEKRGISWRSAGRALAINVLILAVVVGLLYSVIGIPAAYSAFADRFSRSTSTSWLATETMEFLGWHPMT